MSSAVLEKGLELHQAGKFDEAEAIYREVLAGEDDTTDAQTDAWHFLGLIMQQRGQFDQAIEFIERAILADPTRSTFYYNLGATFMAVEDLSSAAEAYDKACQLKPDWLDALVSLGTIQGQLGKYPPAETTLRQALQIDPDNVEAMISLTAVLEGLGQSADAEELGRQAVALRLTSPQAWSNLGNALNSQGKLPGKLNEAEEAFRHALSIDPSYNTARFNLGNVLNDQWRNSQALACFREVIERDPIYFFAWQNLLLNLLYSPVETEQSIFETHKSWAEKFGSVAEVSQPADRDSSKRLKIGYVSPDFRTHSVAYFLKPLIAAHDRKAFEIYAYSNVRREDDTTSWFKDNVDHWRDVTTLSDAAAASLIQQDQIDILVDLAGHSANNRLGIFASKPSPVQISWLGYPATTGLPQIEHRLTDEIADPSGDADKNHSEQLIRLEGGFHCYQMPEEVPNVGSLPALDNGFVTFGSFNHISKISPRVIETWSEILASVPNSKLLLKGGMLDYEVVRGKLQEAFEQNKIAADRIVLKGWIARDDDPLELYNSVDICLDPFPYNGTTTTFEALSMGVPVITLLGARHSGRVGASIMSHLGRPEWITDTRQSYKALAGSLAGDLSALQNIRQQLRSELLNSTLSDAARFAAKIETVCTEIYRDFCQKTLD